MARILVYTSPARGHLFPILGPALELAARGHAVRVHTLADAVELVRAQGLESAAIDPAVEAIEMDDWQAGGPRQALMRGLQVFAERAPHDHADLSSAIESHAPDVLIVDNNSWGAQVAADASGLPWSGFQPYFTPLPSRDVPTVGMGFPLRRGPLARLRDRVLTAVIMRQIGGFTLPVVNRLRSGDGLPRLDSMEELLSLPPRTLYFTAEPFEYPRSDWPDSFAMVGPATWAPPSEPPPWLEEVERPIVLATCSTELQDDRAILEAALAGLADEDVYVVGSSAAHDPASFEVPSNARVEAFLPHQAIVGRAAAVVCHGGMGITQRALAEGVPVCVVPFGRDQVEVSRHVEEAAAGVRLLPKDLDAASLRHAVRRAMAQADGARRVADAFAAAGGSRHAADVVEEQLGSSPAASAGEQHLALGAVPS